jgi:hypothetical protein
MKKPNLSKLTVRRETLRALSSIELTKAVGGDDTFSGAVACPLLVASSAATCPAQVVKKMKKPNLSKLAVRRESLRALSSSELTRAAGGDDTESGRVLCPLSVASSVAMCPLQVVIK